MARHWRVEVFADGEQILSIEPGCLAGKDDLTEDDKNLIRLCADQLDAFAGTGESECFICGAGPDDDCMYKDGACPMGGST